MADKNFKVKSGLQVPSLTTAGPVTTDSAGNVTSSATLPITQGGTGQTTAGNALNALLPLQTSQDNKFLQTNGVSTQWTIPQQQTSTDGTLGYKIYSGTVTPSSPVTGDIWIDQTTGNGIQLVRWRKTIASSGSTITGLDDNNLTLSYTAGNEQVYINGTLITRGQDYTATNGTSISLTQSTEVGDTVEIFGNPLFSVTDVYTQAQSNSLYVSKAGFDAAGKNVVINGNFDIWQRGTSFNYAGSGSAVYTADRFQFTQNPVTTYTITQDSSVPNGNSAYSYKCTATAANSSTVEFATRQWVEGSNVLPLIGKIVTLSFWYKSNRTGSHGARIGGAILTNGVDQPISFTVNSPNTWEYKTITYSTACASATSLQYGTTGVGLFIDIGFRVGNAAGLTSISLNDYFQLSQVQLEAGSVPTLFSRAGGTIAGELAACQRYFQRFGNSVAYEPFGVAHGIDVNNARMYLPLKVNMRTNPTFSSTAASTFQKSFGTTSGLSTIALGASSNHAVSIDFSRTSEFTANGGFIISSVAAGNAYIDLSAEL